MTRAELFASLSQGDDVPVRRLHGQRVPDDHKNDVTYHSQWFRCMFRELLSRVDHMGFLDELMVKSLEAQVDTMEKFQRYMIKKEQEGDEDLPRPLQAGGVKGVIPRYIEARRRQGDHDIDGIDPVVLAEAELSVPATPEQPCLTPPHGESVDMD